jgi:hypothetical protein
MRQACAGLLVMRGATTQLHLADSCACACHHNAQSHTRSSSSSQSQPLLHPLLDLNLGLTHSAQHIATT